ncbi:MAG: hypothetical protein JNJ69_01220 [Leptospiraceae bacterium]|nr:hypothetical protein [Leptospiraceae bacterium]
MAVLSFPLWMIFAVLMPILMLFFVLGFSAAVEPAIKRPPPIERSNS